MGDSHLRGHLYAFGLRSQVGLAELERNAHLHNAKVRNAKAAIDTKPPRHLHTFRSPLHKFKKVPVGPPRQYEELDPLWGMTPLHPLDKLGSPGSPSRTLLRITPSPETLGRLPIPPRQPAGGFGTPTLGSQFLSAGTPRPLASRSSRSVSPMLIPTPAGGPFPISPSLPSSIPIPTPSRPTLTPEQVAVYSQFVNLLATLEPADASALASAAVQDSGERTVHRSLGNR